MAGSGGKGKLMKRTPYAMLSTLTCKCTWEGNFLVTTYDPHLTPNNYKLITAV